MDPDPAPATASARAGAAHRPVGRLRRLGRDYLYVLPGLPLAVLSFVVLVALTAVSLGTLVIWVGALLMPMTLVLASTFAGWSRRRLRAWGRAPYPVEYHPARPGPAGVVRLMADPRRWLDLVFEAVFAFPMRLVTFVIAVVWTGIALGGLTLWIWWQFVPMATSWPVLLLSLANPQLVPQSSAGLYLVDAGAHLILGVLFLLTLPAVMRGLAGFDAFVSSELLGGQAEATIRHDGDNAAPRVGSTGARAAPSPGTRWVWASTWFVALVLLAVSWPVLAALYGVHPAAAMVLTVAHSAAAVVAIRWPLISIGLFTLASLAVMLATSAVAADLPWPWPVTSILTQCLLMVILALRHPWYWVTGAWSAGTLLTALAFVLIPDRVPGGLANGVVLVSVTAGLALLGVLERLWRQGTERAQQAEELSAEETQRRRDLEERNRIARELHDVVAHSMSVINVQATTAQYRKPGIDESVQQEFNDIARSSRQALSEMRSLLAVLRDDTDAPTAPVPTLDDVPELIETARAAGATITDSIETEAPATVGLTAYRIIQEALSNALRHAPGAAIEVTTAIVDTAEDTTTSEDSNRTLTIEVLNSAPDGDTPPVPGSGLGLAGIRERVTTLGGTVEAGPTDAGGFCVSASLPVGEDRAETA